MFNSNILVLANSFSLLSKPNVVPQFRSVDVTVNHCKSVFTFSTALGAVFKCKGYSGITVESGTHVKSVLAEIR